MKIIISENTLKPILYKLFDFVKSKYGHPVLDFNYMKLFNMPDGYYDRKKYRELFVDYIGGVDEARKLGETVLNEMKQKVQTFNLEGAGNIDFKIDRFTLDGEFEVDVTIVGGNVLDENSESIDIFDFYEDLGMGEWGEFEDYIKNEINEYLFTHIFKRTGLNVTVDSVDFDYCERITCENCGWSWRELASDPDDKYMCHRCGHDNEKGV